MSNYEYHELHNEESTTALNVNSRNITLVWVDKEAVMEFSLSSFRIEQTIRLLKKINGENYKLYNNIDQFLDEIEHLCQTREVLVILSGAFANIIISKLTESSLINEIVSVVIFCTNDQRNACESLLKHHKVLQICTNESSLKAVIEYIKSPPSNFVICDRDLKPLFHLGKEFEAYSWYKKYMEILTDNYQSENKRESMLTLCTSWYETNAVQIEEIQNFYKFYKSDKAIEWYTKDCFLYRVVNKALRTLDMETINAFRFYIKALSKQLEELHNLQKQHIVDESLKLYRGYANMTTLELNKIRENIGGLISFNGFTSTTKDFELALGFAISKPTHESIVFQILTNYNLKNMTFADIAQYSQLHESEVLFGLCSVFRITNCFRNDFNGVSIIEMVATDEDTQKFQDYARNVAEMVIENKPSRLLHRICQYSKRRRFILQLIIGCLIFVSIIIVVLVGLYTQSKHHISSSNDCEGINCSTSSTSTVKTATIYNIVPTNTGTTKIIAATRTSARTSTSTLPTNISKWFNTTNMITPRYEHTASLLQNGQILVVGGNINQNVPTNTAELYNPSTGNWTSTGSMNFPRLSHTASVLSNGKVLIIGESFRGQLHSTELYDPLTGNWTFTGYMISQRLSHTASVLDDGQVLVAGGSTGSPEKIAEVYDPRTGVWKTTGNMTIKRGGHTASVLKNGKVLVTGGNGVDNTLDSSELYDPVTGNWTITGSMTTRRIHHTASVLKDGKVLVTGGSQGLTYKSAELYDPLTEIWTATDDMNNERKYHTASVLHDGHVLVIGGAGSSEKSAELYDPSTGTWTPTGSMAYSRISHIACVLKNGSVLVSGGAFRSIILNSAELF